jgi:hypothetical protein
VAIDVPSGDANAQDQLERIVLPERDHTLVNLIKFVIKGDNLAPGLFDGGPFRPRPVEI